MSVTVGLGMGLGCPFTFHLSPFTFHLSPLLARKAGIEPTLTVLETALLPLEDFRKNAEAQCLVHFSVNLGFGELRKQAFTRLAQDFRNLPTNEISR